MRTRFKRSFRVSPGFFAGVEGLEDRRLLSGNGPVISQAHFLTSDPAEVGQASALSRTDQVPGVSGGETGSDPGTPATIASGVASTPDETSSASGEQAAALNPRASQTGGDISVRDLAESAASAGAQGSASSGPFLSAAVSPSQGAATSLVIQGSGGRSAGAAGDASRDDEASAASLDSSRQDEAAGTNVGATVLSASGAVRAGEFSVPLNLGPMANSNSALVPAGGILAGPLARDGDGTRVSGVAFLSECSSAGPTSAPAAPTAGLIGLPQPADLGPEATPPESRSAAVATEKPAEAMPAPSYADLASELVPFDRATLERAIDQCLAQFEGLAAELAQLEPSTSPLSVVTLLAITALASGVVRRRRRLRREKTAASPDENDEAFIHLPGLPSSWNWGLAET
jgi:hypothetical protein